MIQAGNKVMIAMLPSPTMIELGEAIDAAELKADHE